MTILLIAGGVVAVVVLLIIAGLARAAGREMPAPPKRNHGDNQ